MATPRLSLAALSFFFINFFLRSTPSAVVVSSRGLKPWRSASTAASAAAPASPTAALTTLTPCANAADIDILSDHPNSASKKHKVGHVGREERSGAIYDGLMDVESTIYVRPADLVKPYIRPGVGRLAAVQNVLRHI